MSAAVDSGRSTGSEHARRRERPTAIERQRRAGAPAARGHAASSDPDVQAARSASQAAAVESLRDAISGAPLAVGLLNLEDGRVRAASNAVAVFLGLPIGQIVGRPILELLDPRDRPASAAALAALRSGSIDFFRSHRHGASAAAPRTGFIAWVRRVELGGQAHAFARWVTPGLPPGPWPSPAEVFEHAVAIAVTDAKGFAETASVCPNVGADFSLDALLGRRIVPMARGGGGLVTLADWRAARLDGVSIAFPASLADRSGAIVELEGIATALAGPPGWIVVLVKLDPPSSAREGQLEGHLWRIAAEVEASGILLQAGSTPGLSLVRIPEAASLTARQWDILRRLVAGQRVSTIASELYVSSSTVRNHLSAIFERFGVHSQAALLARLSPSGAPSIGTHGLPAA